MTRLRTFIAVDLEPSIRQRLVRLQESLMRGGADVKWVEEENLHVSLLFLGEVDERDVLAVCRATEEVCKGHAAFGLHVEGVGCFPNPRRPRVFWVGVSAGTEELCALHEALEPPLLALGCYRREERQFTPHITLGRTRGERPAGLPADLQKYAGWQGGEQMVREVHVLSSQLTPKGPIYSVLSRARLRTAGKQSAAEEE
jgi:2'-5' RNA ligase